MTRLICAIALFALLPASTSSAEDVGKGDYVITTKRANVHRNGRVIGSVPRNSYFEVLEARTETLRFLLQTREGERIEGWVKADDVLRIPDEFTGTDGHQDSLEYRAAVYCALPPGKKLGLVYRTTGNVDLLILKESEFRKYLSMMRHRSREYITWAESIYARSSGTVYWVPPNREKYYAVFDNTSFPDEGVNLKRNVSIWYALSTKDSNEGKDDIDD